MGAQTDKITWSITVSSGNQLYEIREELTNLISQKNVTESDRVLMVTALSEICRSLMKQIPEFSFHVANCQQGHKTGMCFEFQISNQNIKLTESSNTSQTRFHNIDLRTFKTVFDDLKLHTGSQHSASSLVLAWWISKT